MILFKILLLFIRFLILFIIRCCIYIMRFTLSKISSIENHANNTFKQYQVVKYKYKNEQKNVTNICFDKYENSQNHLIKLRLMMQRKEIGSIIGKNGKTIEKIRKETKAKIYVSSNGPTIERIIDIKGTPADVIHVFNEICQFYKKWLMTFHNENTENLTIRILIPVYQCGLIIGKNGWNIRELRRITNTFIQVDSGPLPNSTECLVSLNGNLESLSKCISYICDILYDNPCNQETIYYHPMEKSSLLSSYYHNYKSNYATYLTASHQ